MIAFLLLQAADVPAVPSDWATLAPMPYVEAPNVTTALAQFVASEIAAKRCVVAKPVDGHYVVKIDVAALVGTDGMVRRAVPHAIRCPSVEQYAAGLVTGFARGNLATRGNGGDVWYRATITFDWLG